MWDQWPSFSGNPLSLSVTSSWDQNSRRGQAPYERLSASHSGLDPLEPIKRELREIDDAIDGLKDEATQSNEAQKYAKTMLKLLTSWRTDLLAMKQKWLQAA